MKIFLIFVTLTILLLMIFIPPESYVNAISHPVGGEPHLFEACASTSQKRTKQQRQEYQDCEMKKELNEQQDSLMQKQEAPIDDSIESDGDAPIDDNKREQEDNDSDYWDTFWDRLDAR